MIEASLIAPRPLLVCLALLALGVASPGCRQKPKATARPPELAQYEQGQQRERNGDLAGAQAAFDTALRLNRAFVPAWLALVEIDQRGGNFAAGVERLQAMHRAVPAEPHVVCRIAELYVASGRFEKGWDTVQEALSSEPNCPLARAQSGLEMDAAGKAKEAVGAMETAHRLAPQSERITLAYAQMLARGGQTKAAWKLLDAFPAGSAQAGQADYLRGWLLAERGKFGQRDLAGARAALDRVLARVPDHGPANLEKGRILLRQGKLQEARSCLEKSVQTAEPSVELFSAIADLHRRLHLPDASRLEKGARAFAVFQGRLRASRQSYVAGSNDRATLLGLAQLEAEAGNAPDAQELLTRLLQRNPNDAQVLALLTPRAAPKIAPH